MDTRPDAIERLERDIGEARDNAEAMQYLTEYLAEWGPEHVDVQSLAERCLTVEG